MGEEYSKEELIDLFKPDWDGTCSVCENETEPIVPLSGFCGPCHFGTAEALGGDWWHDTKQELKEGF